MRKRGGKIGFRRLTFRGRINLIVSYFFHTNIFSLVLSNGGNDSIKFKTEHFDFRGEKGRNKGLDVSEERFNCSTFKTNEQRVQDAQDYCHERFFQEKYRKEEE